MPWMWGLLFLIPTALYLILTRVGGVPPEILHFLLTLSAVMGVHLLERAYLNREFQAYLNSVKDHVLASFQDVRQDVERVRDDIKVQTSALVGAAASMETMRRCGLVKIYPSRGEANLDMKADLLNPENHTIRLIGVSLNDFAQGHEPHPKDVWKTMANLVSKKDGPSAGAPRVLDIRILIIDPDSFGAQLRSHGESRVFRPDEGRLRKDVIQTAEVLLELESLADETAATTGVRLQCRLYRIPPILFLCLVDACCYVQQYHFWSSRSDTPLTPVLRYESKGDLEGPAGMHRSMRDHFDWIWDNAAVTSHAYLKEHELGADKGSSQCGVSNIFTDPDQARGRLLWLLRNAKSRVLIQGNSLRSFFSRGSLLEAIDELIRRGDVEIELLLLDPDSEQAVIRSYREYLLAKPPMSLDAYRQSGLHKRSSLYKDTESTLDAIRDIQARHRTRTLKVRMYQAAPSHFMALVDDTVLVEHYNYGKVSKRPVQAGIPPLILGKDMPVLEYRREAWPLYDRDPLRSPFALMENHFRFVFDQLGREISPAELPG